MFQGQIKLSRIFDHNFDKRTDRLYQPLRLAVETLPTLPSLPSSAGDIQAMKCSQINISRAEQDVIRNSTFIPINKKLVQTNNPEKHLRARSRSYRTLSVEQRIGSPLHEQHFQPSLPAPIQQQIVYDYDTATPKITQAVKLADYYSVGTVSTLPRTRSATYVGGPIINRPERAETRMMKVQRRPSEHSGASKGIRESKEGIQAFGGEYYEDCKKYAFKGDMKEKGGKRLDKSEDSLQREVIKTRVTTQEDYKYNLFSLLDDPINSNCSNGCGKHGVIAPKIKKRW